MSNDVQTHEDVVERSPGAERRDGLRHAAGALGSVTARIIGGSQVDLVNFSSRGVLFECDSRLLIGARASVRITTSDANLIVTGRVVRSRVKGLVNGALRYDAALVLDSELNLVPALTTTVVNGAHADLPVPVESVALAPQDDSVAFECDLDASFDPAPLDAYIAESEASLVEASIVDGAPDALPPEAISEVTAYGVDARELAALDGAVDDAPARPADEDAIAFEADDVAFEPSAEVAFEPAFDDGTLDAPALAAVAVGATGVGLAALAPEALEAAETQAAIEDAVRATHAGAAEAFEPHPTAAMAAQPEPVAFAMPSEPVAEPESAAESGPVAESEPAVESEQAAVEFEAAVDFDGDIQFESVAFDAIAPSFDQTVPDPSAIAADAIVLEACPVDEATEPIEPIEALPDEPPAPIALDDRVMLQFAATVPHDLAELRRIAADNQW